MNLAKSASIYLDRINKIGKWNDIDLTVEDIIGILSDPKNESKQLWEVWIIRDQRVVYFKN